MKMHSYMLLLCLMLTPSLLLPMNKKPSVVQEARKQESQKSPKNHALEKLEQKSKDFALGAFLGICSLISLYKGAHLVLGSAIDLIDKPEIILITPTTTYNSKAGILERMSLGALLLGGSLFMGYGATKRLWMNPRVADAQNS